MKLFSLRDCVCEWVSGSIHLFRYIEIHSIFKNTLLSFNFWSIIINVRYHVGGLLNWIYQFKKERKKLDIKNVPTIEGKAPSAFYIDKYTNITYQEYMPGTEIKEHQAWQSEGDWEISLSFHSISFRFNSIEFVCLFCSVLLSRYT